MFESLETRRLLAVNVSVTGSVLTVIGDKNANSINVIENAGAVHVETSTLPDSNPVAGAAIFVDETDGSVITTQQLSKVGPTSAFNGVNLTEWSSSAASVNIPSARVGVVIALSGIAGWTPSGTLTQICDQILVECYDGADVGPWTGLDFIRGFSTAGTGTASVPILRDVTLYNQSCTDNSGPYFLLHAGCSVGVRAKIDFGTGATNPEGNAGAGGVQAVVKVDNANTGCPNAGQNPKGCVMRYQTAGPNAGYFVTDGSNGYPVMAADGLPHPITINWGTGSGRTGTNDSFANVQRSYSAGAGSDPVQYITVTELAPGANSLTIGAHTLHVTIGVVQSLQQNQTDPAAPAVALKVLGSRTQAIDCDPAAGTNMTYELGNGCRPTYKINSGVPCNTYQYYSTLPQTAPWECTRTQTGGAVGQVYQGMLDRTQGGVNSCSNPINWLDADGDGLVTIPEDIPPGDPRIIQVFVTPFGSFNGSGNAVIPITNFATFYVTGFSKNGGGQGDPCPGADPVPAKAGGWIVGHFIKYIPSINTGGGGTACNFSSFGTCVAVLTH